MRLHARGITVRGRDRDRLRDVTCELAPGEAVGVIGPNGAGKSTLLRALAGIEPVAEGTVHAGDVDVHAAPRRDVARRVAWMEAQWSTPFALRGLDAALIGRTAWLGALGLPTDADRDRARRLLDTLGVGHLADRPIPRMSTGERQRVHLAAVWLQDAPILLLDEPTSAQDLDGVRRVFGAIDARRAEGAAVLAAVHDLTEAARRFDRLIVLHRGAVVAQGAPADVLTRTDVRAAWNDAWDVVTLDGELIVRSRRL